VGNLEGPLISKEVGSIVGILVGETAGGEVPAASAVFDVGARVGYRVEDNSVGLAVGSKDGSAVADKTTIGGGVTLVLVTTGCHLPPGKICGAERDSIRVSSSGSVTANCIWIIDRKRASVMGSLFISVSMWLSIFFLIVLDGGKVIWKIMRMPSDPLLLS
jgi:hypothetical protein